MIQFELPSGHHETFYNASEIAKYLSLKDTNGKYVGRNKFLQFLRFNGLLMKHSNEPKQQYITLDLMRYHFTTKKSKNYGLPIFSDKGVNYIKNRIIDGRFTIGFTKRIEKYKVQLDEVC